MPIGNLRGQVWATVTDTGDGGILLRLNAGEQAGAVVQRVRATSDALGAELFAFDFEGKPARGVHVFCRDDRLINAFAGFCEPLVDRRLAGDPLVRAFDECLQEFRSLLERVAPGRANELTGLLGELFILSELVAIAPAAVDTWVYPVRERHDFRNGVTALEVKTSLRSQNSGKVVRISSFDQLEPPDGGELFLHWLRLERDPNGPISGNTLIDSITSHLSVSTGHALRERLVSDPASTGTYDQRYALQERLAFRVVADFPRLSDSRLKTGGRDPGIGAVSYDLDLGAAMRFVCPPDVANESLLRGMQR